MCRASYVDHRVIDRYREGRTIIAALDRVGGGAAPDEAEAWQAIEEAVLELVDGGAPRLSRRFAWPASSSASCFAARATGSAGT